MEGGEIFAIFASSSVLVALCQIILPRIFEKHDKKDDTKKFETEVRDYIQTSKLNDAQTHLLLMINNYPNETLAIKMEAETYIVKLHGNSWVMDILRRWAKENDVDISDLEHVHTKNLEEQKDENN